jgi:cell division protein FtsA
MRYICGIDIGSSKIAACLGGFRGRELTQIWWDSVTAAGVKRGQVEDAQGLTAALSKLLKNLEAKSGIKIKSVYLGIASQNIVTKHSQATIALAERGNKSVAKRDIQRVNQQAQILGSCLEDEILHSQPLSYTVDNENEVINPLGLYGHRLKVNLCLICARSSYINTIVEIINRLGLKLNDITLSALAVSQSVFNPKNMGGINILCDVGKDITQILINNDGRLMHYQIITSGGDDLTTMLSEELNLAYSLAEEIKISYGQIQDNYEPHRFQSGVHPNQQSKHVSPDKEIIVKIGNAYSTLSQNLVIQSRASYRIIEAIRDAVRPHLLAVSSASVSDKACLYVSGRTACLEGFLELLEAVMGMPVKLAKVGNPSLLVPLMRRRLLSAEPVLNYLASLGLIAMAIKLSDWKFVPHQPLRNLLSNIPEKIREVYQEYF